MPDIVVPLTRGLVAIVDAADAETILSRKWYAEPGNGPTKKFYASRKEVVGGKRITLYMHRLLMSPPPGLVVDHIDNDGLNNRRSNLRVVTHSQNLANSVARKNISGFRGVYPSSHGDPWVARISIKKKNIHIGRFKHPEDAARAYDKRALEIFGCTATLNFPLGGE